jgi:DNA-binding response OmpR family regulator
MRGPQLVEVARAVHPESAVLFASGYSTEIIGRRGELPDDLDLINKPYSPDELLRRVRDAIDRNGLGSTQSTVAGGPTDPTRAVR